MKNTELMKTMKKYEEKKKEERRMYLIDAWVEKANRERSTEGKRFYFAMALGTYNRTI